MKRQLRIRIGTRGSRLALSQTQMVATALRAQRDDIDTDMVIIETKGDKILDKSLDKIGDKGLFVAEIEEQLRTGDIDLAIHSMKDLPTANSDEFVVFPILAREDPRDALVTRHRIDDLSELPAGAVIGTGSKRRQVELQAAIDALRVVPIRGNVETRIQKMLDQQMDGTILAAAGLSRLDLVSNDRYHIVPIARQTMVPAPAQGILACQIKRGHPLQDLVKQLMRQDVYLDCLVERSFLRAVDGSCHLPIGAHLVEWADRYAFHYLFGNESCTRIYKGVVELLKGDCQADCEQQLVALAQHSAERAMREVRA